MSKIIITPLGTISPYTKGNMNCPGFLVEYNSKKILLDCGNGITRLLNFPNDLKDLNVILLYLILILLINPFQVVMFYFDYHRK